MNLSWYKVQARVFTLALAIFGLQACALQQGTHSFLARNCVEDARERIQAADWSKAEIISLRIRQSSFNPMIIGLKQNRPYVIRINNGDDSIHVFRAGEFFRSVALAKVEVDGFDSEDHCITAVSIDGGETAEIQLVAVRDGRYEFDDNPLLVPWVLIPGAVGIIYIE